MIMKDESYKYNYLIPTEKIEFPVKVNIHIPVRSYLYFECVKLNKQIMKIANSEISFLSSSFQIPHITLYMGFVITLENLQKTLEKTEEFTKTITSFQIKTSKPYLKRLKNNSNWVFLDVSPIDYVKNIKHRLQKQLGLYIEPLAWDVVEEPPHLTIAYIKENLIEVERVLNSWNINTASWTEAIEVSYAGARGSCIGSIRTYELTK